MPRRGQSDGARHDVALHLAGPRVRGARQCVAHVALDPGVASHASRAEDADGIETRLYECLAHRDLGQRRTEIAAPSLCAFPAGAIEQETRALESQLHVGDAMSDRLVGADWATE